MVNRAVFLDRDGVINQAVVNQGKPYPPKTPEEFQVLPGVAEACQSLKEAGYLLVVTTNQPDVGRGTQTASAIEQMHAKMCAKLPVDRIEVCYDSGDSPRRKPNPGMLFDAARALNINLRESFMVGDRWRDIDAGNAAGCSTVLIDRGYDEPLRTKPAIRSRNLTEAASHILLCRLRVKIYADGADQAGIIALHADPLIKGLTTNPTLMHKAGIRDYEAFAKDILQIVREKPLSLEVFSDEFPEMRRQALKIASWGDNVYVKIPITNTKGESSRALVKNLTAEGVKLNVTAILTLNQVRDIAGALSPDVPAVVSIFAGRIADTGIDPIPVMRAAKSQLRGIQLLWASVREVWNIFEADAAGCDIVTVPHDILAKAKKTAGTNLSSLSLETVKMFAADARAANYTL